MGNYKISLNAGPDLDIASGINKTVLPLLNQAVRAIAKQAAENWVDAVYGAKLWQGEKDAYAQSITWTMTGDFSARVEAGYEKAQEIETGRPPRDLKKMLDTSHKVRRTLDGRRFLVIPLRANTPGSGALAKAMPKGVYKLAKAMTPSRVVGQGQRATGELTVLSPKTGMHPAAKQTPFLSNVATKGPMTVNRNQYQWGGRLTAAALRNAGLQAGDVKRYAGMVRFDKSTGGRKSSAYLNFRIMIDGQTGWVIPAQPGQYILKKVVADLEPKAQAAFAAAVEETVKGG